MAVTPSSDAKCVIPRGNGEGDREVITPPSHSTRGLGQGLDIIELAAATERVILWSEICCGTVYWVVCP